MSEFLNEILTELSESASSGTLAVFAVCVYVGILAACALAIYDKRIMGGFVRTLIAKGATSPEKAMTLAELGYVNTRSVKSGLRGRGIFAGTVFEASEKVEFDRENHALPIFRENFDPEKARFYIPEPLTYRAAVRFEKKGTHIMVPVVAALVLGIPVAAVLLAGEEIMEQLLKFLRAIWGLA